MRRLASYLWAFFAGLLEFLVVGVLADGQTRWDRAATIVVVLGLAGLIAYLWITRGI